MKYIVTSIMLLLSIQGLAQKQYADTLYSPPPFAHLYEAGKGPTVFIDEAHHNFHTKDGRYRPFAHILELDGYQVASNEKPFSKKNLSQAGILVISNALPESSVDEWVAPTASAFTDDEIDALETWVRKGGRLFLIADHMPMAGAARDLGAAFGFTFYDSFADDSTTASGAEIFTRNDGSLSSNIITGGIKGFPAADSVTSFTGQAFQIPATAQSILNCGEGWIAALPDTAWVFPEDVKILDARGWSQGAFMDYGKGKIVVFGEAAMFSAQIAEIDENTRYNAGMNSPRGKNNYKLLVNIIRWLDM